MVWGLVGGGVKGKEKKGMGCRTKDDWLKNWGWGGGGGGFCW